MGLHFPPIPPKPMTYLLDASGVIYNDGVPFPGVVDKIYASGQWWRVVNVKTTAPAGVPVVHELQLRL